MLQIASDDNASLRLRILSMGVVLVPEDKVQRKLLACGSAWLECSCVGDE